MFAHDTTFKISKGELQESSLLLSLSLATKTASLQTPGASTGPCDRVVTSPASLSWREGFLMVRGSPGRAEFHII